MMRGHLVSFLGTHRMSLFPGLACGSLLMREFDHPHPVRLSFHLSLLHVIVIGVSCGSDIL